MAEGGQPQREKLRMEKSPAVASQHLLGVLVVSIKGINSLSNNVALP
jgi:hypothetical protein